MSVANYSIKQEFLGAKGAKFLTIQYWPELPPIAHILYLPPFGEEMNRCRALVAEQARNFASMGYSCTVIDFYGTGDSEGELQDASFNIWYSNIATAIDNLIGLSRAPLILWGLRLGGLIALDYAGKSGRQIDTILLWQPVTSGKRFVTQMLRQRVASLVGKDAVPETTQEIRKRLASGLHVEISGYTVADGLLSDVEDVNLSSVQNLSSTRIIWMEHVGDEDETISLAAQKILKGLVSQGNQVESHVFTDPPMWQLHKRDHAPGLLALTERVLSI